MLLLSMMIEFVWFVSCFSVSSVLYGCMIMFFFCVLGKIEYVWMSFLGNLLLSCLSKKDFRFELVLLVIECMSMKF